MTQSNDTLQVSYVSEYVHQQDGAETLTRHCHSLRVVIVS